MVRSERFNTEIFVHIHRRDKAFLYRTAAAFI
jgi:hypothetical protein